MAPEIPRDFTGSWKTGAELNTTKPWDPSWNLTIPAAHGVVPNTVYPAGHPRVETALYGLWSANEPLRGVVKGCPHIPGTTCRAKLRAPALAITECTSHLVPVDYKRTGPTSVFFGEPGGAPPLYFQTLHVGFSLVLAEDEQINFVTGYSRLDGCEGQYNYTACTLRSAIGEYDVTIEDDAVTLDSSLDPTIFSLAQNAKVNQAATIPNGTGFEQTPSTLAGIAFMATNRWFSTVEQWEFEGHVQTFVLGDSWMNFYLDGEQECQTFTDPHNTVLASLNKLMVYAGAYAGTRDPSRLVGTLDPGLEVNSTITGYLVGDQNVFHTEYGFFVAAAIVELVCILLILPTYWGWWKLGRPVSFSPLEMAKVWQKFFALGHVC